MNIKSKIIKKKEVGLNLLFVEYLKQ